MIERSGRTDTIRLCHLEKKLVTNIFLAPWGVSVDVWGVYLDKAQKKKKGSL